jgi:hypothetical protein
MRTRRRPRSPPDRLRAGHLSRDGQPGPARAVVRRATPAGDLCQSDLIDAGQPAKWGKLQIDADIPRGGKVLVASRSGNVKDVDDPTFSDWTEPVEITATRCNCAARSAGSASISSFSKTDDGRERRSSGRWRWPAPCRIWPRRSNPSTSPGCPPRQGRRLQDQLRATDDNDDKLIYRLDFRKLGRTTWIQIKKDKIEADNFEWDGKTVEDGRYEVRVTASDERGNSPATKLTASRISEPIVVDNTGPVIRKYAIEKNGRTVTLKLEVTDELSVISRLEYTSTATPSGKAPCRTISSATRPRKASRSRPRTSSRAST